MGLTLTGYLTYQDLFPHWQERIDAFLAYLVELFKGSSMAVLFERAPKAPNIYMHVNLCA
jgi:hypothetical protein